MEPNSALYSSTLSGGGLVDFKTGVTPFTISVLMLVTIFSTLVVPARFTPSDAWSILAEMVLDVRNDEHFDHLWSQFLQASDGSVVRDQRWPIRLQSFAEHSRDSDLYVVGGRVEILAYVSH